MILLRGKECGAADLLQVLPHSQSLSNLIQDSTIWGCHGGEYKDGCLLGCSAV
jgi:hypothetical protein